MLRGAAETLNFHRPYLYYEDSMLPSAERGGALINQILALSANSKWQYSCRCRNDCFCMPPS